MNHRQLFEDFIMQNLDGAYRFAFTYTKSREDAEDVVNESVLKALRSLPSLQNPAYLKTWFYRIIANTALTSLRRQQKVVLLDGETAAALPDELGDRSDLSFHSMIRILPEKYRVVVALKFCEDMTFREIAEVLATNENTVKTRLYKALEILKIDLEGDTYE